MRNTLKKLLDLPLQDGNLLILTHDNPDPDCLASSAAMQYLVKQKMGVSATVAYSGIIGRAENRAMVHQLDLHAHHVMEIDFEDYKYLALIDAQPRTGNTAIPDDRRVDIVIDHHPLRDTTKKEAMFFEIRPKIGATATILTEYLRLSELEIPTNLATALLYGIRSETQDLGREVSVRDRRAYEYLFPRVDTMKLAAISRPTLERRYYQQLAVALSSMLVGQHSAICSMGDVSDPDFVPEVADLAVRMEGIEWSLALGDHDGRLYVSIRTNDAKTNAGEVMQSILAGLGRGGGHGMRAGGNVDLRDRPEAREATEVELRRRFLEFTGESPSRLRPIRDEVSGSEQPAES